MELMFFGPIMPVAGGSLIFLVFFMIFGLWLVSVMFFLNNEPFRGGVDPECSYI